MYLYGASNLWLSRRAALTAVRSRFKAPIEICLACGPGRSYGLKAGNPLVRYRSLQDVSFPTRPPISSLAILSDAGNDIIYAQSPETTLGWIKNLAQKLEKTKTQIAIAGLPLESLSKISRLKFFILSRLYYLEQSLSFPQVLERLGKLEEGLKELCLQRGYTFLPTNPAWYGFDRVHLKRSACASCWESLLEPLYPALESPRPFKLSHLFNLKPADAWVLGKKRYHDGLYDSVMPDTLIWVR